MTVLLILAAPVALILWSLEKPRLGRGFRLLLISVGAVLLGVAGYSSVGPQFLGDGSWYDRSPWKEGMLLLAMLVGMAVRSLDEAIEIRSQRIAELEKKGELKEKPKLDIDAWDFFRPFLVSVPTFGGLLSQVSEEDFSFVVMALAFQTGFFWRTILEKNETRISESG